MTRRWSKNLNAPVVSGPAVEMTTIIGNATIVTGNPGRAILYDAALAVQGDRIMAIGSTAEIAAKYPDAETVDASRKAIFPGLINCHTHLLATADRGILEDFGFPTTLKSEGSSIIPWAQNDWDQRTTPEEAGPPAVYLARQTAETMTGQLVNYAEFGKTWGP